METGRSAIAPRLRFPTWRITLPAGASTATTGRSRGGRTSPRDHLLGNGDGTLRLGATFRRRRCRSSRLSGTWWRRVTDLSRRARFRMSCRSRAGAATAPWSVGELRRGRESHCDGAGRFRPRWAHGHRRREWGRQLGLLAPESDAGGRTAPGARLAGGVWCRRRRGGATRGVRRRRVADGRVLARRRQPTSLTWRTSGTGSVASIPGSMTDATPRATRPAVRGEADITVCFRREDVARLFTR